MSHWENNYMKKVLAKIKVLSFNLNLKLKYKLSITIKLNWNLIKSKFKK
jgi:hypothetical protein